ncbi:MAG: hypothetical protein ABRQ38_09910 [Candidatus Eremiobacterota bacterium]
MNINQLKNQSYTPEQTSHPERYSYEQVMSDVKTVSLWKTTRGREWL